MKDKLEKDCVITLCQKFFDRCRQSINLGISKIEFSHQVVSLVLKILSLAFHNIDLSSYLREANKRAKSIGIDELYLLRQVYFEIGALRNFIGEQVNVVSGINNILNVLRSSFLKFGTLEKQSLLFLAFKLSQICDLEMTKDSVLYFGTDYTLKDLERDLFLHIRYKTTMLKETLVCTNFFYDLFTERYIKRQFKKSLSILDKKVLLKSINCPVSLLVDFLECKTDDRYCMAIFKNHPNLPCTLKLRLEVDV